MHVYISNSKGYNIDPFTHTLVSFTHSLNKEFVFAFYSATDSPERIAADTVCMQLSSDRFMISGIKGLVTFMTGTLDDFYLTT